MLKIYSEDGKSFYRLFFDENVELVNPLQYFRDSSIISSFYMMKDILDVKAKEIPKNIRTKVIIKKSLEEWEVRLQTINNEFLDGDFLMLLKASKKKDQLRLLKGKSLTPNGLAKLLITAYSDFGFTFSRYTSEKLPSNIEKEKLPIFFELNDSYGEKSKVTIIGETELKEGQLINVVNHRKKIVANFLDKENEWHCFYLTYKALSGKESWNNGQPHYHYLSDKFNLTREEVIQGILDGNVPSTPVHIGIKDYRKNNI